QRNRPHVIGFGAGETFVQQWLGDDGERGLRGCREADQNDRDNDGLPVFAEASVDASPQIELDRRGLRIVRWGFGLQAWTRLYTSVLKKLRHFTRPTLRARNQDPAHLSVVTSRRLMNPVSAIYLRMPNWIGDVCMSLPSLDAVLATGVPVVVCARGWARDLLAGYGLAGFIEMTGRWREDRAAVHAFRKKAAHAHPRGLLLPDSL